MLVSIPLGIFFGLLASFVQSLGLTIQRKSHVLNSQLPETQQKADYRRPLWLLGFAIFITSNILGSLVQIASLPVVILAPLGAVSLLWNAFFARFILGDVFSPWMILGTLFIAGGAVLIAIFGIVPEPTRSLEDLLELFRRPAFVAYFSLLGALVVICLVITHIVEYSFKRKMRASHLDPPSPSTPRDITNPTGLTTGVTEGLTTATEQTPLLVLDRKNMPSVPPSPGDIKHLLENPSITRTRLLIAISFASFSGIISGMCLLFAKSGVELLLLTVKGHNQFWRWESWMLLFALCVFALLQLWYLHKALVLADPTLVCPSAFCFYNLSSIVNGLVYFNQFALISPLHLGLVVIGIVVLLAGVWVVSIQAGGGGVDVDRWAAEDAGDSDSGSETSDTGPRDLEAGNESRTQGRFGPLRMERQSVSESEIFPRQQSRKSSLRIRPPTVEEIPDIALPLSTPPPLNDHAADFSTPEPSLILSPGSRSRKRRRYTTALPESAQPSSLSPPLSSGSVLSAGLSIGLGPMSPGFSIVRKERRRRVSGIGFPDVVEDVRAGQRRRTVSEGDLRGRLDGEEVGLPVTTEAADTSIEPGARSRWKWVRRVFVRR